MEITLSIKGQELKILGKQPNLYHGSIGVLYIKFCDVNFDASLVKTVRFKTKESDWYTADVIDGMVRVPHEVIIVGGFDVAVGGYDTEDGELLRFLPTNSVHIDVLENGYGEPDAPLMVEGDSESVIGQLSGKADKDEVDKELLEINRKLDAGLVCLERVIPKTTVGGNQLNISDHLIDMPVLCYKVFGNSMQEGTPSPDNPVEIESVGDLVTDETSDYYGQYRLPVSVNGVITNIYIKEPLRKVGSIADYIDYKNQQVVRNISHMKITSSLSWNDRYSGVIYTNLTAKYAANTEYDLPLPTNRSSTDYRYFQMTNTSGTAIGFYLPEGYWPFTTKEEMLVWLDTHEMYVEYPLATPVYEDIEIPGVEIADSEMVQVELDTKLSGEMEITYYQDINKVISELKSVQSA